MNTDNTSKKNNEKVVVSWTGGKDGCFACYNLRFKVMSVSYVR